MNVAVEQHRPSLRVGPVAVRTVFNILSLTDLRCIIEVASDGSSIAVANRRNLWAPIAARRPGGGADEHRG